MATSQFWELHRKLAQCYEEDLLLAGAGKETGHLFRKALASRSEGWACFFWSPVDKWGEFILWTKWHAPWVFCWVSLGLERQSGEIELYRQPSGRLGQPAATLTTSSNITKERQEFASFWTTFTECTLHCHELTAFRCRLKVIKARSFKKGLLGRTNTWCIMDSSCFPIVFSVFFTTTPKASC